MDLRQLEYFAAVARHRHFTRAAQALFVSQPALSQQIRRLEAELGVALLERTPGGVEVTSAGADLLQRAESILAEVGRARAAMDEHAGVLRGSVRVAAATGEAPRLPAQLAAFHREHPGVHVAMRQTRAAEVVELVRRGGADVGVVALPGAAVGGAEAAGVTGGVAGATEAAVVAGGPQAAGGPAGVAASVPAGVAATPLASVPLRVIGAPGDDLGVACVGDLRGRPLILGERGSALREAVMEACAAAGFSPIPPFEVGDPGTVRFLAHTGLGLSVVPAFWLDEPGPEVAVAPLAGPGLELRPHLLAPAAGLSPTGRLLHEQLRAALGG